MALPLYLAMTAAEMRAYRQYPGYFGYMAVHFSPEGIGISNMPPSLPEGAMLILNDQNPWSGHDSGKIIQQLSEILRQHQCQSVLLDFQRPGIAAMSALAENITQALPCPVGVSHLYARNLDCPVFLPPVPLNIPIRKYLSPWAAREIWLEAALDGCEMTLTQQGCRSVPLPYPDTQTGHTHTELHCHYTIDVSEKGAVFTLLRTRQDLSHLLEEAAALGVTRAIGLWQELRKY